MEAAMQLDEAIRILKGKPGSIEALGPEYVRHARAAEVVGNAHRRRTSDQSPNLTPGGLRDPDLPPPAGPRIVMQLPGPASSYGILSDARGNTWLVQHASVSDVIEGQDPVRIRSTDRAALSKQYRAMTAARDAETRKKLEQINEANRKAWAR
jgi:hypothetical protein